LFASLSDCKQLIAANKLIHLAGLRGASRTSADVVTIYLHSSTPCPSPVNIMREARAQQDFVLETSLSLSSSMNHCARCTDQGTKKGFNCILWLLNQA